MADQTVSEQPTSKDQAKPFGQWSRRELIDRVRGLDAAKDESTFAIELLIAAGFVSREKADEARAIVRSWGPTPEPGNAPTVPGYTTDDDLLKVAYSYAAGSQFTQAALLKMLRNFESVWRRPSQPSPVAAGSAVATGYKCEQCGWFGGTCGCTAQPPAVTPPTEAALKYLETIAALTRDAERYRWLRGHVAPSALERITSTPQSLIADKRPEALDAEIDLRIAGKIGPGVGPTPRLHPTQAECAKLAAALKKSPERPDK